RRAGIGREERLAETGAEDDDAALLHVPDRAPRDVRLGDLSHRDRGLHPRLDAFLLQEVLQPQAVDDRAEHAHVVRTRAVDTALREQCAAKHVAATDDDCDLHATAYDVGDLTGDARD